MKPTPKPTFLVFTHLPANALPAAYFAGVLAAAVGGRLVLQQLEEEPGPEPDLGMLTLPAEYYTRQAQDANDLLAELAQQLPAPATVAGPPTTMLAEVLGDLLRRWRPQLLVMGLSAEHDLLDALLANRTLPALREAGVPLLLVPDGAARSPRLPRMVAVAADGEAFRLNPASLALSPMLGCWPAAYCVVHVAPPDGHNAAGLDQAEGAVRRSGLLPAGRPITYQVRQASVSAGIVQAVADVQADLLVLLTRPRTLLSSLFNCGVAAHVLQQSPVSVLLLPTLEVPAAAPQEQAVHVLGY